MNIIEAGNELSKGRKIRLSEWEEGKFIQRSSYGLDSIRPLFNQYGENYLLNMYDLLSINWEIYEEPKEYFDFAEAVARIKQNKTVACDGTENNDYFWYEKVSEPNPWRRYIKECGLNQPAVFDSYEVNSDKWYEVD